MHDSGRRINTTLGGDGESGTSNIDADPRTGKGLLRPQVRVPLEKKARKRDSFLEVDGASEMRVTSGLTIPPCGSRGPGEESRFPKLMKEVQLAGQRSKRN